jgi:hypothetical protein
MGFKRSRVQIPPARFVKSGWRSPAPLKTRKTSTAFLAAALIFQCAKSLPADSDDNRFARVKLNSIALAYAKELISGGHVTVDRKGAWAKDRPSTELDNEFIRVHGFSEYAKWHLGIDDRYPENTKRRYKFPYGDFKNVHRCGVLALQARAAEYRYSEIENAAAQLRAMIEATRNRRR